MCIMWIYNRIHHQPYYHHHYYFAKLSLPFSLGFGDKAAFVSPKVNSFLSLFRSAAPLDLSLWIPPERRIGRNLNQIKQWGTGVKNNLLIYHVATEETGLWGLLRQTVINVPWGKCVHFRSTVFLSMTRLSSTQKMQDTLNVSDSS